MDIKDYIQSGIIESYVLCLADEDEVIEIEKLKLQHVEVQQAVDEFALSIEEQAFKGAVAPPADVKQKIMAQLFSNTTDEKSEHPLTVAYSSSVNNTATNAEYKGIQMWRYLAAASIILLVVSAVTNFYLYDKYSKTNSQYVALLTEHTNLQASNKVFQIRLKDFETVARMMADPVFAMVQMKDPKGIKNNMTTVFWDKKTKDVYLLPNILPLPAKDKQYQLWALVDGKPVNAGVIDPNCKSLCRMANIPKAQGFAITLEKAGGSPTPTLEQLLVLGNV